MSDRGPAHRAWRRLFVGALREAEPAFSAVLASGAEVVALVTLDAESGARTPRFVDLTALAGRHKVPVLSTGDLDAAALVPEVRRLSPTLLVRAGWPGQLHRDLHTIPTHGAVGFHASLLPRYRGGSPVAWAILRGETMTGTTMVMLVPGASNADIVDQREVPIRADDTCATVWDKVAEADAQMLRQHLRDLLNGTAPRRRQMVHHFDRKLPERTPAMGITSFDRTSAEVYDWIRALTRPCTGAFVHMRGERVVLWSAATLHPERRTHAPPGTVLGADGDGVVVTTRTGAVRLLEVQPDGELPQPAALWLEHKGLPPGCVFEAVDPATRAWTLGRGSHPGPTRGLSPGRRAR